MKIFDFIGVLTIVNDIFYTMKQKKKSIRNDVVIEITAKIDWNYEFSNECTTRMLRKKEKGEKTIMFNNFY